MGLQPHYDVIVVGAGPAGSTFAKALAAGSDQARILVVDRCRFPRDKVCGDGISLRALQLIEEVFPGLRSRFSGTGSISSFTVHYPDGYFHRRDHWYTHFIPRYEFDHLLFEQLTEPNIDILQEALVDDLVFDGRKVDGVVVRAGHGEALEVRADWVIGADGSNSLVSRRALAGADRRRHCALRQYVRGIPEPDHGVLMLLDGRHYGYFWAFPFRRDGEWWANIGYGNLRGTIRERYAHLLRSRLAESYLGAGTLVDRPKGFPLHYSDAFWERLSLPHAVHGHGFLLLGDAAGLIHPYTGEGIFQAVYSGKLAAELFLNGSGRRAIGARYERRLLAYLQRASHMKAALRTFRLPCMLPHPLRNVYVSHFCERDFAYAYR